MIRCFLIDLRPIHVKVFRSEKAVRVPLYLTFTLTRQRYIVREKIHDTNVIEKIGVFLGYFSEEDKGAPGPSTHDRTREGCEIKEGLGIVL